MDDNEVGAYEPNTAEYDDDSVWGYEVDEPKGTTYAVLSGADSELEYVPQLDEPIHVKPADLGWVDLRDDVEEQFKAFLDRNCLVLESTYNLMSGTCHLINTLIQRHTEGKPVDTIIFMDKAARLAAHLFNVTWALIEQRQTDTADFPVKKPQIRFINSGREPTNKFGHTATQEQLRSLYRAEDFTGNVMIVDEYVQSGSSLRKTWRALTASSYAPKDMVGMAQFAHLPEWYMNDNVKGVKDPEYVYVSEGTIKDITALPEKLTTHLKTALRIFGYKELSWYKSGLVSESGIAEDVEALSSTQRAALKESGIDLYKLFVELRDQCAVRHLDPAVVMSYVATAGGFLALRPDSHQLSKTTEYRKMLRFIAEEAFKRGLVETHTHTYGQ